MITRLTRAVAVVFGSALLLLGAAGAVDALALAVNDGPAVLPWDEWYADATAQALAGGAEIAGAILVAIGMFCVALACWPRTRERLVDASGTRARYSWKTSRRALEARVASDVQRVVGVERTRTRVRDGSLEIRVTARRADPESVVEECETRARRVAARLGVPDVEPQVRVREKT